MAPSRTEANNAVQPAELSVGWKLLKRPDSSSLLVRLRRFSKPAMSRSGLARPVLA